MREFIIPVSCVLGATVCGLVVYLQVGIAALGIQQKTWNFEPISYLECWGLVTLAISSVCTCFVGLELFMKFLQWLN